MKMTSNNQHFVESKFHVIHYKMSMIRSSQKAVY